jgi:hypothetical protein
MKPSEKKSCEQLYANRMCSDELQAELFCSALAALTNRNDSEILRFMLRSINDKNEAEEIYQTLINTCCEFSDSVLLNTVVDEIKTIKKNAPEYSKELLLMVFSTRRGLSILKKRFSEESDNSLLVYTLSYLPDVLTYACEKADLESVKKMIDSLQGYLPDNARNKIRNRFNNVYAKELKRISALTHETKASVGKKGSLLNQIEIIPLKGLDNVKFGTQREIVRKSMIGKFREESYTDYYFANCLRIHYDSLQKVEAVSVDRSLKIPAMFGEDNIFTIDPADLISEFKKQSQVKKASQGSFINGSDFLIIDLGIVLLLKSKTTVEIIKIYSKKAFKDYLRCNG